jgi:hypothetical protein
MKPNKILSVAVLCAALTLCQASTAQRGENLIQNGDFSQGNTGFVSSLLYWSPRPNGLWEAGYTVANSFVDPVLHVLITPAPYSAPSARYRNAAVLFANAGGKGGEVIWSQIVRCRPRTRYQLSFQAISLSGSQWAAGHEVPTPDWVPQFMITVNGSHGPARPAGCGSYLPISMEWEDVDDTSAVVSIIRMPIKHGGGLVGIADITMTEAFPLPLD